MLATENFARQAFMADSDGAVQVSKPATGTPDPADWAGGALTAGAAVSVPVDEGAVGVGEGVVTAGAGVVLVGGGVIHGGAGVVLVGEGVIHGGEGVVLTGGEVVLVGEGNGRYDGCGEGLHGGVYAVEGTTCGWAVRVAGVDHPQSGVGCVRTDGFSEPAPSRGCR
jgi:hypothetical protein